MLREVYRHMLMSLIPDWKLLCHSLEVQLEIGFGEPDESNVSGEFG